MIHQAARLTYLALAIGLTASAHAVLCVVKAYTDGKSQAALLILFRAWRVYGALLTVNMVVNLALNDGSPWGLWMAVAGAAYLVWAMVRFMRVVRGW